MSNPSIRFEDLMALDEYLLRGPTDTYKNVGEGPMKPEFPVSDSVQNAAFQQFHPRTEKRTLPGPDGPFPWPVNCAAFPRRYIVRGDDGSARIVFQPPGDRKPVKCVIPAGAEIRLPRSMRSGILRTECVDGCGPGLEAQTCQRSDHAHVISGGVGIGLTRLDDAGDPVAQQYHPALVPKAPAPVNGESVHALMLERARLAGGAS